MIDPKELRIGNKIAERDNHRIYEVKNILLNRVVVQYWSCGEVEEIHFSKLIPIPLTPEILERCGFIKDVEREEKFVSINGQTADTYYNDTFNPSELALFKDGSIHAIDGTFTFSVQLKYLHQLQNLYFALTGEELKINLNVEAHQ